MVKDMTAGDTRRSITLFALVQDETLADEFASVAGAVDAELKRLSSVERLLDAAPDGEGPWLIEAELISDSTDQERLYAQIGDAADIILIGGARQRERLSGWLSTGRAFYLRRPVDVDYLVELLRDIVSEHSVASGDHRPGSPPALDQYGLLYGSSPVMRELYRHLRKAARTDATLLVCGESGTGKELVVRSVHSYSERSEEGFEGINCSAIPADLLESELFGHEKGSFTGADRAHRGLFERAGRGTLFLDEITEMPLDAQAKLLRVLETGNFRRVGGQRELRCEARVMAASNRDPMQAIEGGELREDLYYRICQMEITVPPLRDRGDDIVHLARLFARLYSRQTGLAVRLSAQAEEALLQCHWPGNVRELRHCILQAARLSRGVISSADLNGHGGVSAVDAAKTESGVRPQLRAGMRIADVERSLIELTLAETGGNKQRAAGLLGISVRTLYNRLERYARER
jgi:DNA-binding NtrC family response regulator